MHLPIEETHVLGRAAVVLHHFLEERGYLMPASDTPALSDCELGDIESRYESGGYSRSFRWGVWVSDPDATLTVIGLMLVELRPALHVELTISRILCPRKETLLDDTDNPLSKTG